MPKIEPAPKAAPPAVPTPPQDVSDNDQKKIDELIQHSQLEYSKIKNSFIKEKKKEIDALNHQIKEFVGPYILIGYDLNNNPIEVVSANSQSDHDALLERLRRLMYKVNQNIINSGGTDPYGLNS